MNDPGKSLGIIDTALRYLPKDTVLNERKTYLVKLLEQRPYEKEINTANEYFNKADYINAIKSLTALINKNANLMSLYEVRGKSSFFIHDYKKSIPDLTIAIQRKPDAGYLYNFRGACYHNLGQDDLACKDFEKGKLLKDKSAEDNYSKFCNKLNNLKLK
jgi:tetratricopeptide (TPR) repeat protein